MVVRANGCAHKEFEAVYVDGKRFVHARQVFPSELYKKAVAWRILKLGQAGKLGHYDTY
jgi:predicted methyltransferase